MPKMKVKDIDGDSIDIKCPHCNKVLTEIWRAIKGFFMTNAVYVCPHCRCVLSVGHDRAF